MYGVVAETGAVYVAMHWRGHADVMDDLDDYDDVVTDVRRELAARVAALRAAGVRDEQVVLDPGLGFAKAGEQQLAAARAAARAGGGRLPGAGRREPQAVPRAPAGGPGRRAGAAARAGPRDGGGVRAGRGRGSLVRAGARGGRLGRRGAGGRGVAGCDRHGCRCGTGDDDELAVDEDARTGGSTR